MSEEKNKKEGKTKKFVVLPIIIIALIALVCVGGYFGYQQIDNDEPIDVEWGEKYYEYIEKTVNEDSTILPKQISNGKIEFIQPKSDEMPIMKAKFVDESANGVSKLIIFYNNENQNISYGIWSATDEIESFDMELLYNIELGEYRWYFTEKHTNGGVVYIDLLKTIERAKIMEKYAANLNEYFQSEEGKRIEKEITDNLYSINFDSSMDINFDDVFILPENVERKEVDFESFQDLRKFKKSVKEATIEYKEKDEVVPDEAQEKITEKVNEINEKKEAEKKAAEEAAKKAAEEAAKKAAEEAAKGLKIGSKTIKYGRYKGEGPAEGQILTINSNGTATLKLNSGTVENYTYIVGKYDFSQDVGPSYQDAIIFKKGNTTSFGLYVGSNGHLIIDPTSFVYIGE